MQGQGEKGDRGSREKETMCINLSWKKEDRSSEKKPSEELTILMKGGKKELGTKKKKTKIRGKGP